MAHVLIPMRDVKRITSLSDTEIDRRMDKGTFPKSIKLGPKRRAWIQAEVEEWIQARINESRGEHDGPRS